MYKPKIWGKKNILLFFLCLSILLIIPPIIYSQPDHSKLEKAQWLYQHENYEEALPLFKQLRQENPQSADIAYYLGLTYKRMQDYLSAKPHLEAAVELAPKEKHALLELIDLLYQSDEIEEAKKWIAVAERESVTPAQTAFFKGLVLLKEGKDPEAAVKSFQEAEKLDPSLAQTVKYQKGLAYMQLKDYTVAKSIFREIITRDPAADLSAYANEYIDALTRVEEAKRPWHLSLGYSLQYDNNVVFRPPNDALSTGVAEKKDLKHVFTAQTDYTFKPTDSFGVKTGASFYGLKNDQIGFYDTMSYDLPLQPTFYLKKATVSFPMHYNYVQVNDRKYLSTIGLGNLNNFMLDSRHMLQTQAQYNIKDYQWAPSVYDDKKTGREYLLSLGWYSFYARNNAGLLNLRYAVNFEDTKGRNWTYLGNRLTFVSIAPLLKNLKWIFTFDYFRENFRKQNSTYQKKRHDDVYTVSDLLAWEFMKNIEAQLQHTFVYDGSSIGVYKYRKHIYSAGLKYRF